MKLKRYEIIIKSENMYAVDRLAHLFIKDVQRQQKLGIVDPIIILHGGYIMETRVGVDPNKPFKKYNYKYLVYSVSIKVACKYKDRITYIILRYKMFALKDFNIKLYITRMPCILTDE